MVLGGGGEGERGVNSHDDHAILHTTKLASFTKNLISSASFNSSRFEPSLLPL